MFARPTRLTTLGAVLTASLAIGACDEPGADTDLRPEGPPEILAVLVFNDSTAQGFLGVEMGTYCKPNDAKRPGKVGIPILGLAPEVCPLDGSEPPILTDADPDAWYVRIMFDELLDPNVETLIVVKDANGNDTDMFNGSLAETQPVTLQCQDIARNFVDVPYDGYYSPSGNRVTWPVGPSLVVLPRLPNSVPIESECKVSVKESVKDKDGNSVPSDQRVARSFKIAPISTIAGFDAPAGDDTVDPAQAGVDIGFNVRIDPASLATACTTVGDANCFQMTPADKAPNPFVDFTIIAAGGPPHGIFVGADYWVDDTEYTFKAPQNFKIKDKCLVEGVVKGLKPEITFKTNPTRFISFNPAGGSSVAPIKGGSGGITGAGLSAGTNQVFDWDTFVEGTDWTLNAKPAGFIPPGDGAVGPDGTAAVWDGIYNINTNYVLTIKAGAKVTDITGKEFTFTNELVTNFTTAGLAITAQAPAENARVVKAATAAGNVTFTFNQVMNVGTLIATEYTITKADGTPTGVTPAVVAVAGVPNAVRISSPALPAGQYTFTLKQGATIEDGHTPPNVYTQAADRVIHFTIADAAPPAPAFKCLGQP